MNLKHLGGGFIKKHKGESLRRNYDSIKAKKLTKGIDLSILDEFIRVLKKPNLYIWCNKKQLFDYLKYFENTDFIVEILIWHKTNVAPLYNNGFLQDVEYLLYVRKGITLNNDYEHCAKVFHGITNQKDKDLYKHPTIKPYQLVKLHLEHSTNEGDVVLDPFVGSGTTCAVAKELNRQYLGFEIDEEFYKIATDRLNGIDAKGQMSLFTNFEEV